MPEKLTIRPATPEDAPALLEIYTPYVTETAVTFEYDVPTVTEFAGRICKTLEMYPYLVAEMEGVVVGYAYAAPFKARAAYAWAVETTIYLRQSCRRMGIGRALYAALEEQLQRQHILNANACIAYAAQEDAHLRNDSLRFHANMGYRTVGTFHQCGYKFGKWYDIIWMEKLLGEHSDAPAGVLPFGSC